MRLTTACCLIVGATIAGVGSVPAQTVLNIGAASHHQRRADLHRREEGLFPRGRLRGQGHQLPLGRRHGGAARHRSARRRRGLRLGRPLQRDAAGHQDQDRRRQGVVGAGLWRDQDPGAQGPRRQRPLQGAEGPQGHEVRHERARRQQHRDAQRAPEVGRAQIFRRARPSTCRSRITSPRSATRVSTPRRRSSRDRRSRSGRASPCW